MMSKARSSYFVETSSSLPSFTFSDDVSNPAETVRDAGQPQVLYQPDVQLSGVISRSVLWDRTPIDVPHYIKSFDVLPALHMPHISISSLLLDMNIVNKTVDRSASLRPKRAMSNEDDNARLLSAVATTSSYLLSVQESGSFVDPLSATLTIPFTVRPTRDTELEFDQSSTESLINNLSKSISMAQDLAMKSFIRIRAAGHSSVRVQRLRSKTSGSSSTADSKRVYRQLEGTIRAEAVIPDVSFVYVRVQSIPVLPTDIYQRVLKESRNGGCSTQFGYVTMNQTRKLVFFEESDPAVSLSPVMGVWVSLCAHEKVLTEPEMMKNPHWWGGCVKYLFSERIKDRAFVADDTFLMVNISGGCATCYEATQTVSLTHTQLPSPMHVVGGDAGHNGGQQQMGVSFLIADCTVDLSVEDEANIDGSNAKPLQLTEPVISQFRVNERAGRWLVRRYGIVSSTGQVLLSERSSERSPNEHTSPRGWNNQPFIACTSIDQPSAIPRNIREVPEPAPAPLESHAFSCSSPTLSSQNVELSSELQLPKKLIAEDSCTLDTSFLKQHQGQNRGDKNLHPAPHMLTALSSSSSSSSRMSISDTAYPAEPTASSASPMVSQQPSPGLRDLGDLGTLGKLVAAARQGAPKPQTGLMFPAKVVVAQQIQIENLRTQVEELRALVMTLSRTEGHFSDRLPASHSQNKVESRDLDALQMPVESQFPSPPHQYLGWAVSREDDTFASAASLEAGNISNIAAAPETGHASSEPPPFSAEIIGGDLAVGSRDAQYSTKGTPQGNHVMSSTSTKISPPAASSAFAPKADFELETAPDENRSDFVDVREIAFFDHPDEGSSTLSMTSLIHLPRVRSVVTFRDEDRSIIEPESILAIEKRYLTTL